MEILYLWVDNYRNLNAVELNFGGQWTFHFDQEKNVLNTYQNENFIPDFFEAPVSSVTAFIGRNGSGKSNILRFIYSLFNKRSELWMNRKTQAWEKPRFIMVYRPNSGDKNKIECTSFGLGPKIKTNFKDAPTLKERFFFISLTQKKWEKEEFFHDCQLIYFSNTFDSNLFRLADPFNLSTNHLIYRPEKSDFRFDLRAYFQRELEKQLRFIKDGHRINGVRLPPRLTVLLPLDEIRAEFMLTFHAADGLVRTLLRRRKELKLSDNELFFRLFVLFAYTYTLDRFNRAFREGEKNPDIDWDSTDGALMFASMKPDETNDLIEKTYIANFETALNHILEYLGALSPVFQEANIRFRLIFDLLQKYLKNKKIVFTPVTAYKQTLSFDVSLDEEFIDFIKAYADTFQFPDGFLQLQWQDMSSGEVALMNLFSRLYSVKNKLAHRHLVLCLDEGDLYLHPQWQKEYLSRLMKFLKEHFSSKSIHLILTSHSPFLISDLPKEHIVLLKYNGPGEETSVEGLENNEQTFGANIHQLYADAFFMQGGLIGNFAKEKIDSLIVWLSQEDRKKTRGVRLASSVEIPDKNVSFTKESSGKLISIIGEPILRMKLEELWENKFGSETDIERLERERERLDQKIQELKNKNNTSSI